MSDSLSKLPYIEGSRPAPDESEAAPERARATPEDEAAAGDRLGRTNDGPVAVNRELPEGADHGDRDRG